MRKLGITAALLAVGVVIASGAFAQEIKFDGYVNTGIGILSTDAKVADGTGSKTADIKVVPFGVDSEQAGYRFRLNGSYVGEDGNSGAKFRLQAQSKIGDAAGAPLSIPYAYGWGSFLNKVLTVSGGLVDDGTWTSPGFLGDDQGEGLGALVRASPVEGLNLGAGAYVISPQGGSNNNVIIIPAGKTTTAVTDFTKIDIGLDRLKYTFNAGYTLPELLKLTFTFRTANQTGNVTSKFDDSATEVFNGNNETSRLIFGAQVLLVKDLTAVVEVEADKLEDTGADKDKDNIDFNLYETLGYKLGDLAFGLNAVQYIRVEKDADKDLGLHLNPWVSYTLGSIVPRLDLNYFLAGTATTAIADAGASPPTLAALGAKYHRKVFAYKDNGDADDLSVIAFRPSVKFNVGKGFIEIGDLIAVAAGPDGAFADADDPQRSSSFDNVFYVDFKWSF
jgi:hypothetical protein